MQGAEVRVFAEKICSLTPEWGRSAPQTGAPATESQRRWQNAPFSVRREHTSSVCVGNDSPLGKW